MNIKDINKLAKYDDDWLYLSVKSRLFGETKIEIALQEGTKHASEKQVNIINDFLKLDKSAVTKIEKLFFEFFEKRDFTNNTNYKFKYLLIWETESWKSRFANLIFRTSIDSEDELSVLMKNGELVGVASIQDYFYDYEDRIIVNETEIEKIASSNSEQVLDKYLSRGRNINDLDENGQTIVYIAALEENYEFVRYCLSKGASIDGLKDALENMGHRGVVCDLEDMGIFEM